METMIKFEGLKKKFGYFTAVNELSFEICRNEIFGLLGPNGAGKHLLSQAYLYRTTSVYRTNIWAFVPNGKARTNGLI